jgi:CubicO group peptidase (beta-lactamase class C family)
MAGRVARGEMPGLVILVAHGDGEPLCDAIGRFSFESDSPPMRRDTLFRVASLTKPVVAVATMMLVEDGALRLDEPVDRLLPELANPRVLKRIDAELTDTVPAERPITVEDLLTLRLGTGLLFEPEYDPPVPVNKAAHELQLTLAQPDPRTPHPPDEWIRLFATLPLVYQPGERWMYNVGSLVLGVLVARAARQPLATLLTERIFEPLGMHDTGFSTTIENTLRIPSYYMGGELQPLSPPEEWATPPPFPSGAGGLLSTVDDFLAFGRLLLNKGEHEGTRLLTEKSVDQLTTNHLTDAQIATGGPVLNGEGWGYGMSVVVKPDEVSDVPGRYGWGGGYGTAWFNDPHKNLVAIALSQTTDFMWNGALVDFEKLAESA